MITERGTRNSCLGEVLQVKVHAPGYAPMSWRDVCDEFNATYPGRWAVQVFPPADRIVDSKNVYHLWVLDGEPEGLDLR